jgi:hypothetical protein
MLCPAHACLFVQEKYSHFFHTHSCVHDAATMRCKAADDPTIRDRLKWANSVLAAGGITAPSTIAEEWKSNIFLRCADKRFQESHGALNAASCFAKIRKVVSPPSHLRV